MARRHLRLVDVAPVDLGPRSACRDLVPLGRACPRCGGPLRDESVSQPALLRHGGFGATLRTTQRVCDACNTVRVAAVDETNPRRD